MLRLHDTGQVRGRTAPGATTTGRVLGRALYSAVLAFAVAAGLLGTIPDPRGPGDEAGLHVAAAAALPPAHFPADTPADAPADPTADVAEPTTAGPAPDTLTWPAPEPAIADLPLTGPSTAGAPHPGSTVGLVTFRGNPTRTFHGTGPIPDTAEIAWRYPSSAMCGMSTVGDETKQWCGTGWTGQPAVVERDGRTWVVFGAYDHAIHFVDGDTGEAILPPFPTGDIVKGSVTVDPDGFPIVYTGSRDGRYRAIAIDGDAPRELWALTAADATGPTRWNDDWDGSGLIVDDRLIIGGENSRLFVVQLNRRHEADGSVAVDPEVLWDTAGWDDELLHALGDGNVSIEGSVAVHDDVVYLANSGGLVQGWDISPLDRGGTPEQVLRWWIGDDTDATVVVDDEGMLYVAAEHERFNARAEEVGQVVKLDPSAPDDPLVWSYADPRAGAGEVAGVWGTPALHDDLLIVPTSGGTLVALDRSDGAAVWQLELGDHLWSSPVVVDDVLIQGDCAGGVNAYDLHGRDEPVVRWQVQLDGCVESTPAVWAGRVYVGTRAGYVSAIGG